MKKLLCITLTLIILVATVTSSAFSAYAATVSAPKNISLSYSSNNKIKISWDKVKNSKKYKLYRSNNSSKGFKQIAVTEKNSYTASKSSKVYYYKVKAVVGSKTGKSSEIVSTWGQIRSSRVKEYSVEVPNEGGFSGKMIDYSKVSDAYGYQLNFIYSFEEYYESHKNKIKNVNKLCYGSQEDPTFIKIRAYKKDSKGNIIYGPWKTLFQFKQDQKYDDYLVVNEWNQYIKGYTNIEKYIFPKN
ncbi:hypothetical protein [uncultured Eubacterium sp.]|uniref:hypothetical protein n=1 Tax=uncultured Eubacterium sp. TaxID=165185 RepID=UPI0025D71C91|nr:hypothetical protein [uncultured Eubacterium sp.]